MQLDVARGSRSGVVATMLYLVEGEVVIMITYYLSCIACYGLPPGLNLRFHLVCILSMRQMCLYQGVHVGLL